MTARAKVRLTLTIHLDVAVDADVVDRIIANPQVEMLNAHPVVSVDFKNKAVIGNPSGASIVDQRFHASRAPRL